MMLWKKKPNNSLSNTVAKQCKLYSHNIHEYELSTRFCELWMSQKEAEEKARVEPTLQWSAVLLIHTKARQSVPLTNVQNQTSIWMK